jgi:carboxylate-amine ligase
MALLDHVQSALKSQGEFDVVESLLFQVLTRGTGAARQRAAFAGAGSLCDVIADAVLISGLPATPLQKLKGLPLLASDQSS